MGDKLENFYSNVRMSMWKLVDKDSDKKILLQMYVVILESIF